MMRLATNPDIIVDLHVIGYQHPENHTDEYDSNWLVVEGRVFHPRGDWVFRDPCLLTYEAAGLANWLDAVAADRVAESSIKFIEPNLSFEVATIESRRVLRVTLAFESRPPWASHNENVTVEFPVAQLALSQAIRGWREQIRQFPQRAKC